MNSYDSSSMKKGIEGQGKPEKTNLGVAGMFHFSSLEQNHSGVGDSSHGKL